MSHQDSLIFYFFFLPHCFAFFFSILFNLFRCTYDYRSKQQLVGMLLCRISSIKTWGFSVKVYTASLISQFSGRMFLPSPLSELTPFALGECWARCGSLINHSWPRTHTMWNSSSSLFVFSFLRWFYLKIQSKQEGAARKTFFAPSHKKVCGILSGKELTGIAGWSRPVPAIFTQHLASPSHLVS